MKYFSIVFAAFLSFPILGIYLEYSTFKYLCNESKVKAHNKYKNYYLYVYYNFSEDSYIGDLKNESCVTQHSISQKTLIDVENEFVRLVNRKIEFEKILN